MNDAPSSRLSGITVVATARASSGKPDDDWLPEEAVRALGGETTVLVRELSEDDLDEIRAAEPRLRPILAESHPAKAVARNLFRLSRIARLPTGANIPTTELAMATHWWETADGPDAGRRERQRVLRKVADAAFMGQDAVDVADQDASALDAILGPCQEGLRIEPGALIRLRLDLRGESLERVWHVDGQLRPSFGHAILEARDAFERRQ